MDLEDAAKNSWNQASYYIFEICKASSLCFFFFFSYGSELLYSNGSYSGSILLQSDRSVPKLNRYFRCPIRIWMVTRLKFQNKIKFLWFWDGSSVVEKIFNDIKINPNRFYLIFLLNIDSSASSLNYSTEHLNINVTPKVNPYRPGMAQSYHTWSDIYHSVPNVRLNDGAFGLLNTIEWKRGRESGLYLSVLSDFKLGSIVCERYWNQFKPTSISPIPGHFVNRSPLIHSNASSCECSRWGERAAGCAAVIIYALMRAAFVDCKGDMPVYTMAIWWSNPGSRLLL